MNFAHRQALFSQIEASRACLLIAYVTSLRPNAGGQMGPDAIPELARQILAIPSTERKIDLLIISSGGDPNVAWRIISMLRERFDEVAVLCPYVAYSAATLVALGANEIVMHPFSNLGPVDPQLAYSPPGSHEITFVGAEDLLHFLEFLRDDVGITDQKELQRAFELLCKDVGAVPLGIAKRSAQLSLSLGRKLLGTHMKDPNEANTIAESLSKSFFSHGYPLGRAEAKKIGLPVAEANEAIESLMWQVWESFESELLCNSLFTPVELLYQSENAAAIFGPIPQVQIPQVQVPIESPAEMIQQALNNVPQQSQGAGTIPVEFELVYALVESRRGRGKFASHGIINSLRNPDMSIGLIMTEISRKWSYLETEENGSPEGAPA